MSKKVYVGNLPFSSSEDDVRSLFSGYGSVASVKVITDRETGRSRGFCFVEMESNEGAAAVISNLNSSDFNGRRLVVNEAVEKENNAPSDRPQRQFSSRGPGRDNNNRGNGPARDNNRGNFRDRDYSSNRY